MIIGRMVSMAGLVGLLAAGVSAQGIPEISAACQAENVRIGDAVLAQCLPLASVDAKLACAKRIRAEQHQDPACFAEARRHLVAINHACLSGTAPAAIERAGICDAVREHPTAFAR